MSEADDSPAKGDVLVVDDNPKHLDFVSTMLRNQHYKVRAATDGQRALRAARQDVPDLIMLDVNMPDMDGFAVIKQLKQDVSLKDVPVIFVSAADETLDKVTAFHLGAADYVTKPFQFPEVLGRVEVHIARARLMRELDAARAEITRLLALVNKK
jgi:DNA-binding response OmpR family regulator